MLLQLPHLSKSLATECTLITEDSLVYDRFVSTPCTNLTEHLRTPATYFTRIDQRQAHLQKKINGQMSRIDHQEYLGIGSAAGPPESVQVNMRRIRSHKQFPTTSIDER